MTVNVDLSWRALANALAADFDGYTAWSLERETLAPKFRKQPKQRAKGNHKRGRVYKAYPYLVRRRVVVR